MIDNFQLSRNFSYYETGVSAVHPELVRLCPDEFLKTAIRQAETNLQPLRDWWGKAIKVLSWFRTVALNNVLPGASKTSQHLKAEATDITTDDGSPVEPLFRAIVSGDVKPNCGQVIFYKGRNFIHIALPSERYPLPSFFISPKLGVYVQIHHVSEIDYLEEQAA